MIYHSFILFILVVVVVFEYHSDRDLASFSLALPPVAKYDFFECIPEVWTVEQKGTNIWLLLRHPKVSELPENGVQEWIHGWIGPAKPQAKIEQIFVDHTVRAQWHDEGEHEEGQPTNDEDAYGGEDETS